MRTIIKRKIFAYECDIYSHLNHSRYFNYFEEARSDFFQKANLPINMLTNHAIFVFVTNLQSDFSQELQLEEEISITTNIIKSNPLKLKWDHQIFDSSNNLCNKTILETVFIKNKKTIRLYEKMYKKLKDFNMNVKLAIPSEDNKLSSHFGHCKQFAIYNINDNKVVEKKFVDTPEHTPGAFPKFLNDLGIEVVIAGGMGNKAQTHFKNQGIELITGATDDNLDNLIQLYLDGRIKSKEVKCDHHH